MSGQGSVLVVGVAGASGGHRPLTVVKGGGGGGRLTSARSRCCSRLSPLGRTVASTGKIRCADPSHVVRWATDALDEVRRQAGNESRGAVTRGRAGRASGQAKALKQTRFALWKNPENLTTPQQAKLAWVAKTDPRLHRAYLQGRSPTTGLPAPGR
jgi:transposase